MSRNCKKCGSERSVKNGFVHQVQRYRCKNCGYNYVEGDKRQKYTLQDHLKVLKLYLENYGTRTIERLTGIRNSQISKWIIDAADYLNRELLLQQGRIKSLKDISILEIDELCTSVKESQKMKESRPSYGLLLIGSQVRLLILK